MKLLFRWLLRLIGWAMFSAAAVNIVGYGFALGMVFLGRDDPGFTNSPVWIVATMFFYAFLLTIWYKLKDA